MRCQQDCIDWIREMQQYLWNDVVYFKELFLLVYWQRQVHSNWCLKNITPKLWGIYSMERRHAERMLWVKGFRFDGSGTARGGQQGRLMTERKRGVSECVSCEQPCMWWGLDHMLNIGQQDLATLNIFNNILDNHHLRLFSPAADAWLCHSPLPLHACLELQNKTFTCANYF